MRNRPITTRHNSSANSANSNHNLEGGASSPCTPAGTRRAANIHQGACSGTAAAGAAAIGTITQPSNWGSMTKNQNKIVPSAVLGGHENPDEFACRRFTRGGRPHLETKKMKEREYVNKETKGIKERKFGAVCSVDGLWAT